MPREVITVHIGQCGLQTGYKFWDFMLREHANHTQHSITNNNKNNTTPYFDESMSTFFRNVDSAGHDIINKNEQQQLIWPTYPIQSLRARSVLVDMENGVLDTIFNSNKSAVSELFDTSMRINDVSGSGNNWSVGHMYYGKQYHDDILNSIRIQLEHCDAIQSFLLTHSCGGM